MPELPEVETVKRGLSRLLAGKAVAEVEVSSDRSFPNDPTLVKQFLIGADIATVRRRAKVVLIDLSTAYSLVIHLKMTGQLVYRGDDEDWGAGHPTDSLIGELPDKSTRVQFNFTDGSRLFFNDQRKFGWAKLIATPEVAEMPFFQKLGPEPLEKDFTLEAFKDRLVRRRSNIKAVLLDQSTLAGVGNIYADESLFVAGIHPTRTASDLSDIEIKKLHGAVRQVLQTAIDKGGSSSRNYVDALGINGNYLEYAFVYGRAGLPCRKCETPIEKIRVAGRGTHFCPVCQRPKESKC